MSEMSEFDSKIHSDVDYVSIKRIMRYTRRSLGVCIRQTAIENFIVSLIC
jgi:hypothetical protein